MAEQTPLPYATDPVEIQLSDGKVRRVRFTAGALRRALRDVHKLGDSANHVDTLVAQIWHALLDKSDIKSADELAELIDARAISYLTEKIGEAIKEATPEVPTAPANPVVN